MIVLTQGQKDARRRARKRGHDYSPLFAFIAETKCPACNCSIFGVSVCPNCGAPT